VFGSGGIGEPKKFSFSWMLKYDWIQANENLLMPDGLECLNSSLWEPEAVRLSIENA
jgi:hypothetical protein